MCLIACKTIHLKQAYQKLSLFYILYFQVFPKSLLILHADLYNQGKATATLIGRHVLQTMCVIIEDTYLHDGFLEGFESYFDDFKFNKSQIIIYSQSDTLSELFLKLQDIQENGYRLIIAHMSSKLLVDLIKLCKRLGYLDDGFAWIVSPIAQTLLSSQYKDLPEGLLAIDGYEDVANLLQRTLLSTVNAAQTLIHSNSSIYKEHVYR